MLKARIFDFTLFFGALLLVFLAEPINLEQPSFLKALILYWLFSSLYHHLRQSNTSGNASFDYGISYSLSFAIFAGPIGLFIFETLYRFTVYFNKKWKKTADEGEFLDTFYNIGSFVITSSAAYYLFQFLYPIFHQYPFGFWALMFLLNYLTSYLSSFFLAIVFVILGDFKTVKDASRFVFKSRSILDIGTVALTNSLLLILLLEERWDMLIGLFILNYIVSRSFMSKAQNIQNKMERDKFEQMAYTDFLTGVSNRAYMDKKMAELNGSGEDIGIIVADIDKFKSINDNYNHAVGDQVIQQFARTLQVFLSKDDYLFRSGGEEFTIILRNRNFVETSNLVEIILKTIENTPARVNFQDEEVAISYTTSFGLYFTKVNEQISMEKGYIYADQLLLQSKQLGRNRLTAKNALE